MEPKKALHPSLEDVKRRLKEVRSYTLTHLGALISELNASLAAYPDVEVRFATDVWQAVEIVREISDGTTKIATNRSAVVANELVPSLISSGFQVVESYYDELGPFENRFSGYWELPPMAFESLSQSFERSVDLTALRQISTQGNGAKDFIGLLGVNAISANDGAVLMLQHSHNISMVFQQAKKLILVAGLEKTVKNLDDSIFQTMCMGIFGLEALALGLSSRSEQKGNIESLPFEIPPQQTVGKIHFILFDNGRSQILQSRYKELLACINCRACTRSCPAYRFFAKDTNWSPREYVYFFALGKNPSLELCLQCKTCQANCPLDIDLPGMMLDAKADLLSGRHLPLGDRLFANVETVEKWGSSMPWLANALVRNRPLRWLGEKTLGISSERQLPKVQSRTFAKWFRPVRRK